MIFVWFWGRGNRSATLLLDMFLLDWAKIEAGKDAILAFFEVMIATKPLKTLI